MKLNILKFFQVILTLILQIINLSAQSTIYSTEVEIQ